MSQDLSLIFHSNLPLKDLVISLGIASMIKFEFKDITEDIVYFFVPFAFSGYLSKKAMIDGDYIEMIKYPPITLYTNMLLYLSMYPTLEAELKAFEICIDWANTTLDEFMFSHQNGGIYIVRKDGQIMLNKSERKFLEPLASAIKHPYVWEELLIE